MKGKKVPFWQNRKVVPYLYVAPNMILFLTFMIIPLIMSVYYSMVNWNGLGAPDFIGLKNYAYIFTDKVFLRSLLNTFVFTLGTVPVIMILALPIALLLNTALPLRGFVRASIYAPAVVSTVVVGSVFAWIFNDNFGLFNYLLNLFGKESVNWTSDTRFAMVMVILTTIWQRTGYNMVIYLAGIQSLPTEVLESARMDGANVLQRFRYVIFPMLKNTHILVFLTAVIYSFRSFDLIYTMTKGGPLNSTKTIAVYVYEQAFNKNYFGRASAGGVVLVVIMLIFTILQNRFGRGE